VPSAPGLPARFLAAFLLPPDPPGAALASSPPRPAAPESASTAFRFLFAGAAGRISPVAGSTFGSFFARGFFGMGFPCSSSFGGRTARFTGTRREETEEAEGEEEAGRGESNR
jgi:hypothetical protein